MMVTRSRDSSSENVTMVDMSSVAINLEKLKALREAKGWTYQQAADAAGMNTKQQWYGVESGERANPTIDTVQRMAKALGVKVDDLLK